MSAGLTLFALVLSVCACALMVSSAPFGEAQLVASATAVGAALTLALVAGVYLVKAATGAFVPWPTAVRVAIAIAATIALGTRVPVMGRLMAPVVSAGLGAFYLLLLALMREIAPSDLRGALTALRRRK